MVKMTTGNGLKFVALAALATGTVFGTAPTRADEIYGTNEGCGGWLGCIGFDIFTQQSHGVRFTPAKDFSLDKIEMWFMNNDDSGQNHDLVTVTVEGNLDKNGCSTPDGIPLETMSFVCSATGWNPVLESVESLDHPTLQAGQTYWVVCKSDGQPLLDPVWVIADDSVGFSASTVNGSQDVWQCGGSGGVVGVFVHGTRLGTDYLLDVSPLVGGQNGTFSVTGALPNKSTFLAYSLAGGGSTYIKQLNVTVELKNPTQAGDVLKTDGSGSAQWVLKVPGAASGRTVWFQSVQPGERSNTVQAQVQ